MTFKNIIATILILTGFLGYVVGLIKMCAAIAVMTLCGGTAITLAGLTLIIIGGFMALS
jgi:hypothetical protein